jgi:hypothetical protein
MERDGDRLALVGSGSYPIRGGNAVRPLVDGSWWRRAESNRRHADFQRIPA